MAKFAINTTNIHSGGALQVAISFLYEMTLIDKHEVSLINVYVSTEVDKGLKRLCADTSLFKGYDIYDNYGIGAIFSPLNKVLNSFDVVFTLFGPNYLFTKAKVNIVGFAQMWMLEFSNPISNSMPILSRSSSWFKYYIQWMFFRRSDLYIVELEHVKNKLTTVKDVEPSSVHIVYNTLSSIYDNPELWQPIQMERDYDRVVLGIASRDYPHKNLDIMPLVSKKMKSKFNLDLQFAVTLNEIEWSNKSEEFKEHVINVGELTPEQCPSFYNELDGVFFPSLLECFSATPLEALAMNKPLFASDRDFVRDVCASHAFYFDPNDIEHITDVIFDYFTQSNIDESVLIKASNYARNFSSAKNRAEKYLNIMMKNV